MFEKYKGVLLVVASAAGFGTLAVFMKFAYAAGANAVTILAFRFFLAAAIFWAVIIVRKRKLEADRDVILRSLAMGGIGYGAMSSLFASTVQILPASLAGLLLYTYPAQVSIISFLIGDDRFTWQKGLALGICFSGLLLVLDASFDQASMNGLVLGLSAALVYSVYIVVGNRLIKRADALETTTLVCTAAAFVFGLFGTVSGQLMLRLPMEGWVAIGGIAIFGTVIAILTFFAGMSHVGASNASIISTFEPVVTVILSWLFLAETINGLQIAGGALILAGVLVLQMNFSSGEKAEG